jgi:hypothetical protein
MKIEFFKIVIIEANQNWWINFCIGILIIAIAVRILK